MGPCSECGAMVGHRLVDVTDYEALQTDPIPVTDWRPCSQADTPTVPRAEYARVVAQRDELLAAAGWTDVTDRPPSALDILGRDRDEWKARAEGERRAHVTTNLYAVRIEGFNDTLRTNQETLLTQVSDAVKQSVEDRRALEIKDKECNVMRKNLTTCQARCTELLEENRALRFAAAQKRIMDEHSEIFEALAKGTDK